MRGFLLFIFPRSKVKKRKYFYNAPELYKEGGDKMSISHGRIYKFIEDNRPVRKREKNDPSHKIKEIVERISEAVFQKVEKDKYELTPSSSVNQKKLLEALVLLAPKSERQIVLIPMIKARFRSRQAELMRDISTSFWKVIEKEFGPNPWGILKEGFENQTTWSLVTRDIDNCMEKSFSNFPEKFRRDLADNIRDTFYYFLSFATKEKISSMNRIGFIAEAMPDILPLGANKDNWDFLTG